HFAIGRPARRQEGLVQRGLFRGLRRPGRHGGSVRARHPRGRHCSGRWIRQPRLTERHRARRQSDQPAGAGCRRRRFGQCRDRGHRTRHRPTEEIQHSGAEPFVGAAGARVLPSRSALQAVETAWKAGIVVVVAAGNGGRDNTLGNQGYGTILSPGNDPYVITVGAMKAMDTLSRGDDLIASYSAKGPTAIDHIAKPDLVAPGNQVVSTIGSGAHTLSTLYPQNAVAGGYFRLSGTSMAAPVVSGAAAILLEQNSKLTPDQVKARLMQTATKNFPSTSFATDSVSGVTY